MGVIGPYGVGTVGCCPCHGNRDYSRIDAGVMGLSDTLVVIGILCLIAIARAAIWPFVGNGDD